MHPDVALETVTKAAAPRPTVLLPLDRALDHVVAEDIRSEEYVPACDISLMDGFAVRSSDFAQDSSESVTLRIVDYLPAGATPSRGIEAGEAIRIMTGAPIPAGSDAVVRLEDTCDTACSNETEVQVNTRPRPSEHIFHKGEDIRSGDLLVTSGTLLRPQELGVLASVGRWEVLVHRRPRVAILATGDELVLPSARIVPGQVRSSNSLTLLGQARQAGADVLDLGLVGDNLEQIVARLQSAATADIIVTSGGSAAGDKDFTEQAIARLGTRIVFHRLAIRPGRPILFGVRGEMLFFGLPGNPVASMLTFELFVRPAILKMRGLTRYARRKAKGILQQDVFQHETSRRFYVRVRYEEGAEPKVFPAQHQGSLALTSMSHANALLAIEPGETCVPRGSVVTVTLLDEGA